MARLSFRCDEGLVQRVDGARGRVPRERWLRDAVEDYIALSVPRRQAMPGPNVENIRSSAQAKRDVQPRPKGGKP